jgi:hypothetical protein
MPASNYQAEILRKLEVSKTALAMDMAQAILDQQVEGYSKLSAVELGHVLEPTLDMIFQFFKDGNAVPPKSYITKWAKARVTAGFSPSSVEAALDIVTSRLEKELDQLLTALFQKEPNVEARLRISQYTTGYKAKLENLKALCHVSVIATTLNETS